MLSILNPKNVKLSIDYNIGVMSYYTIARVELYNEVLSFKASASDKTESIEKALIGLERKLNIHLFIKNIPEENITER